MSRSVLFRLLLFVTFALRALPAPAQMPIYYVDESRPDDAGDGRSWASAKKTIAAALSTTTTARQIWVKRGIYAGGLIMPSNVQLYGGFAGDETSLTQRNVLGNPTVIWGGNQTRCVNISSQSNVRLDGFTIAGGWDGTSSALGWGAGVRVSASTKVRIDSCIIAGNNSSYAAGGVSCTDIYNTGDDPSAQPVFFNCVLVGNSANYGGGLYVSSCSPQFNNCAFLGNKATKKAGGVYIYSGATFINCLFSRNVPNALTEYSTISYPGRLGNCLFSGNAPCDYASAQKGALTGAKAINMGVTGAVNNIEGDPKFVMDGAGATTGTSSGVIAVSFAAKTVTLGVVGGGLIPGALQGRLIYLNDARSTPTLILANTDKSLTVPGTSAGLKAGDRWRLFDFHLAQRSQALDHGAVDVGLSNDIEGDPRPGADGLVDIGADEGASALTPPADVTAPDSAVTMTANHSTTSTFAIPYAASDDQSPVAAVRLFYRRNGGAWTQYPDAQTSYTATIRTIPFDSARAGGDGRYAFYTIALDAAGNVESSPATPDATLDIVTAASGTRLCVDAHAPVGRMDGSDWANACPSISLAISLAARFGVKEVWVADGTYAEPVMLQSHIALYGGFEGFGGAEETTLTQRNSRRNVTIINGDRRFTPVTIRGVTNTRLDGFTITGGRNDSSLGGGIICSSITSPVVIADCIVTSNSAISAGGAFIQSAPVNVTGCTFSNNIATGPKANNYAGDGGGLFIITGAGVTMENCYVIGNTASDNGGGVFIQGYSQSLKFANNVIAGNASRRGGGLYLENATCSIDACSLSGNTATDGGGLYFFSREGIVKIANCIFSGNRAAYGGGASGLAPDGNYFTSRNFIHCTFDGNEASGLGGAFYGTQSDATTLDNCIFSRNTGCAIVENAEGYYDPSYGTSPTVRAITTTAKNCLFYLNDGGDFWDQAYHGRDGLKLTGAAAINLRVTGCSGNRDGNPNYVMDGPGAIAGTWTAAAAYDPATRCTTLTDFVAGLTTGALVGKMIRPELSRLDQAPIVANTPSQIVVAGRFDNVSAGMLYRVADMHLRDGSAALEGGYGASGAPATDIDGEPRPGGDAKRDIGADEAPDAFVPADATPPVTQVVGLDAASETASFPVAFSASDTESTVKDVALYYRRNGGSWSQFGPAVANGPIQFNSAQTGGDGVYEFYTIGTDQNGNAEAPPLTPDARVVVAASYSSPRVYVNCRNAPGGDGSSWAKAVPDLRTAAKIAELHQLTEVWVAEGTYPEMISVGGPVTLYGGFAGGETALAQRAVTLHPAVIDATRLSPGGTIVTLTGSAGIDGFTITGGGAFQRTGVTHRGGGVRCRGVNKVVGCRITQCLALHGGGVYCDAGATALIDKCRIYGNEALGYGGAVGYAEATIDVFNSLLAGNTANHGGGVAYCYIAAEYSSARRIVARVSHCTIESNVQKASGAGAAVEQTLVAAAYDQRPYLALRNTILGSASAPLNHSGTQGDLLMAHNQFPSANIGCVYGRDITTVTVLNTLPRSLNNLVGRNDYVQPDYGSQGQSLRYWSYAPTYDPVTNVSTIHYDPSFGPEALQGGMKGYYLVPDSTNPVHFEVLDNLWGTLMVRGDISAYVYKSGAFSHPYCFYKYDLERGSAAIDRATGGLGDQFLEDLDGKRRPLDIRNIGVDGLGNGADIGALECRNYRCTLQVDQTTHGLVTASPALYLNAFDAPYGTTVTLTATPDPKCRFVGWSGNAPAFSQNKSPLLLTLDGFIRVSPIFARESGAVRIDATPNTAPWSFIDGDGKPHSGVGDATVAGVPTGSLTFTWGALAKYDRPAPYSVTRTLDLDTTLTIKGIYKQQVGTVNINIWPATTRWTLTDGSGGRRSGIGSARLANVPIGALKLAWTAPSGYLAPAVNPASLTLANGQEVFIGEHLASAAAATTPALRTKNEIVRYLLGITTTMTGLDLTGDGKVTAADLVRSMKQ